MKSKLSAFILLSVMIISVLSSCNENPDTKATTVPTTAVTETTDAKTTDETTAAKTTATETTVSETTEAVIVNEPAEVYAAFRKDADIDLTNAQRFTADNSEYETEVVFTATNGVKSFSFCKLEWLDETDSGESDFEFVPLYTTDSFNEPLVVTMTFWGSVPSYGIIFTDTDDVEYSGVITTSGEDGSLILDVASDMK